MPSLIDTSFDGHIHTRLCNHAQGEMEEYVLSALEKGLSRMSFLEHLEADINYQPPSWLGPQEFDYYFEEGQRLQQSYGDRIEILLGVETGINVQSLEKLQQKLDFYPFDRVGLSCHFYCHQGDHLNLLSRKQQGIDRLKTIGSAQVLEEYFEALILGVTTVKCDVLCHLDAALRHYPGLRLQKKHTQQIYRLLDAIQAQGTALEINTSGFDYRGTPFPAPWIIAAALERKIPLAAGSDAHHPKDVGRYFQDLPAYINPLAPC